MDIVCIKIYGNLYPTTMSVHEAIDSVLQSWHLNIQHSLEGTMWTIQYEGIYFPTDDVISAIKPLLCSTSQGKLDAIDMDAWTLTRHRFIGTDITTTRTPLNDILAHSCEQ